LVFSGADASCGETSARIPFEAALRDADVVLSSMANGHRESLIVGNRDLYGIVWEKDGGVYMRVPFGKSACADKPSAVVVHSPKASFPEQMAAREIRCYVYLRTGTLLPVVQRDTLPGDSDAILVARASRPVVRPLRNVEDLGPQQYRIKTLSVKGRRVAMVVGGDDIGTLYGAYRLAEYLGVRFFLHGDVVPDEQVPLTMPEVDDAVPTRERETRLRRGKVPRPDANGSCREGSGREETTCPADRLAGLSRNPCGLLRGVRTFARHRKYQRSPHTSPRPSRSRKENTPTETATGWPPARPSNGQFRSTTDRWSPVSKENLPWSIKPLLRCFPDG
jgi:hypothetical protein